MVRLVLDVLGDLYLASSAVVGVCRVARNAFARFRRWPAREEEESLSCVDGASVVPSSSATTRDETVLWLRVNLETFPEGRSVASLIQRVRAEMSSGGSDGTERPTLTIEEALRGDDEDLAPFQSLWLPPMPTPCLLDDRFSDVSLGTTASEASSTFISADRARRVMFESLSMEAEELCVIDTPDSSDEESFVYTDEAAGVGEGEAGWEGAEHSSPPSPSDSPVSAKVERLKRDAAEAHARHWVLLGADDGWVGERGIFKRVGWTEPTETSLTE